jgi:GTP diphosphokinase / guanosine-3',5'-bis(diphosphate) 3'-diphosphatase
MTDVQQLSKAIALTAKVFDGHTDKGQQPYILHCLRVMNGVAPFTIRMTAAVLHDVVEDYKITKISLDDLIKMGFSAQVIQLVGLLTHDKDKVPYMDYIKAIALNEDARLIKMKDLEDNSQITRLKGLGKKDFDRLEKYCTAYEYLKRV